MAVSITFSPTAFAGTYGGSPFTLVTNVDTESAAIVSFDRLTISSASSGLTVSVSSSSISSKTITFSASSTDYDVNLSFTLGWQIKIDDSGQQSTKYGSTTFTLRINAATPTYTAPVLKTSPITATGSAIQLIRLPGSATNGTMYYAVTNTNVAPTISGGTWYSNYTQITGTNPNTYYIWYYVDGDYGYSDINPTSAGSIVLQSNQSWTLYPESVSTYPGHSTASYTSGTLYGSISVQSSNTSIATAVYSSISETLTITGGNTQGTATITLTANGGSGYAPLSRQVTVSNYKLTPPWTASMHPASVYAGQSSNIELDSTTGVSAIGTPIAYIAGTSTVTNKITFGTPSLQDARVVAYTSSDSAGTYDIYVSTTGNNQYANKSQLIQNFTVLAWPDPTYTEPEYSNPTGAVTYGFVYDGISRSIIGTAGTVASGEGTMYYKMETSYSTIPSVSDLSQWTMIPTSSAVSARDAGNYFGWYYILGTYPYNNIGPNRFPNATVGGFEVKKADQTWVASVDKDEADVNDIIKLTMSNTIGYTSVSISASSQDVSITQRSGYWEITSNVAGFYLIQVSTTADSNHNYKNPQTIPVDFKALTPTYSVEPTTIADYTFDHQYHGVIDTFGASANGTVYYNVTDTNVAPPTSDSHWATTNILVGLPGTYYVWSYIHGTTSGYGDSTVIAVSGSPVIVSKITPTWTLSIVPNTINPHGHTNIRISGGYETEWDVAQCVVDPTYSSYFSIIQDQTDPGYFRVQHLNDGGGTYQFAVRTVPTVYPRSEWYSEKILTVTLTVNGIPSGYKRANVYVNTTEGALPVIATAYVNTGTEQNPVWEEVQVYIYDP